MVYNVGLARTCIDLDNILESMSEIRVLTVTLNNVSIGDVKTNATTMTGLHRYRSHFRRLPSHNTS